MLDSLRSSKGGILTWIFLGAIIVVFVISFGPGDFSRGCGAPPAYAARVNGRVIPIGELEQQARQLRSFYQLGSGSQAETAALLNQAMDLVVDRAVVVDEARRRGIVVTDAEISETVHRMPEFQDGGVFQFELYTRAVRDAYGSPTRFEETLRDDLLYRKMLAVLSETVKVSDAEVREAWRAGVDRVSLTFVQFPLAAARAEVQVSEADAKAFADREGDRIEAFHKENPERFDQQRKVRVRHVLARVPAGAPASDDAAARARIEGAAARVKGGEDFAKVAAQVSDDANTRERGGDLGFIAEGLADEDFARVALALEAGQVSEPVRSAAGWHLVKADEVVAARKVPLDAARPEIARELLVRERAEKLARERAQAALEQARKGKPLAELFPAGDAKRKPVTLGGTPITADETGPFAAGLPFVPKLGAAPELAAAAFAAEGPSVLGRVFETPAGPVIAAVTSRERPDDAAFQADRENVERRLRLQKEELVRASWMEELRSRARIERNLAILPAAS